MARSRVRLNNRGVEDLLKSAPIDAATKRAAEVVADNVRDMNIRVGDKDGGRHERDLPVTVRLVTTDRAHAIVALAHPAGEAVQAKHGALTKAATQAGLDVRGKR
jgi:hypothetical protein